MPGEGMPPPSLLGKRVAQDQETYEVRVDQIDEINVLSVLKNEETVIC